MSLDSLALLLQSKKLLADFDAPLDAMRPSTHTDGWFPDCAKCGGEGIIYHALPGSYGFESCSCVMGEVA